MPEIIIAVQNKLPILAGAAQHIVADNSDYTIRFLFDDQWEEGEKTVYFVRSNGYAYAPVKTVDGVVQVPVQTDVNLMSQLLIGVRQGDVKTSRPCGIAVYPAISNVIKDDAVQPGKSLWEQVLDRLDWLEENGGGGSGSGGGIYIGPEETMPEGTKVRIDPNGGKVEIPQIDDTLTQEGYAADAAAVGDAVGQLSEEIAGVQTLVKSQKIEGTPVENTCIKFAKMMYGTDKAESFIFFTDPHVCNPPNADAENKMLINLGILKTYYDATPTTFVVCGGDWLNDIYQSNTNDDACYKLGRVASHMRANFDRWYTAIGNHEDNYPYGAAYEGAGRYTVEEGLSMETLRNLLLPYEKELFYSFDGAHTKFYVMNSSDVENDQQMTDYRWEQVSWLAERLKEDDSANSALVMHSILLRPIGEGVFAHLAENLLKLCEAYNAGNTITLNGNTYDFSGCTGCVRFVLGGHVHDADCAEIHYGIPVVLTYNMCRSADSGNGYNPVFDLCLADYDAGVLRMVRVGNYGADRDIPLASRSSTGDIFTVSLNLTNVTASCALVNVREGDPYENTLSTQRGYTIDSVVVTMGGVDVTDTVYSDGVIAIEAVTGDIVITATATAIVLSYTNLADPTSEDWAEHSYWNDADKIVGDAGNWTSEYGEPIVTNFIPVEKYDVLRFTGFVKEQFTSGQTPGMVFFDENKNRVIKISLMQKHAGTNSGLPISVVTDNNGVTAYVIIIRGDTNQQYEYNDICNRVKYVRFAALRNVPADKVIVTVNEPIYPFAEDDTNLVANALDDNGINVYNEPYGYKNGNTLSGNGGTATNDNSVDFVATGYITLPKNGEAIYIKGADWDVTQNYCRFMCYDHFTTAPIITQHGTDTTAKIFTPVQLGEKYWKLEPLNSAWPDGKWYRISLYGNVDTSAGEELIIAHGKPIE